MYYFAVHVKSSLCCVTTEATYRKIIRTRCIVQSGGILHIYFTSPISDTDKDIGIILSAMLTSYPTHKVIRIDQVQVQHFQLDNVFAITVECMNSATFRCRESTLK